MHYSRNEGYSSFFCVPRALPGVPNKLECPEVLEKCIGPCKRQVLTLGRGKTESVFFDVVAVKTSKGWVLLFRLRALGVVSFRRGVLIERLSTP